MTINPGAAEHPHRQIAADLRRADPGRRVGGRRAAAVDSRAGPGVRGGQADRAAHRRPAAGGGPADHPAGLGHVRARHPAPAQPALPRPVRRPPRLPRRPRRPVPPAAHRGRPRPRPAGGGRRVRGAPTARRWWCAATSCAPTSSRWPRSARRGSCRPTPTAPRWCGARGVRAAAVPGGRGGDRAGGTRRPRTTISARLPSRDEAELLHIRPDTPVLHLLHIAYDAEHRADRGGPGDLAGPDDDADRGPTRCPGRWTTHPTAGRPHPDLSLQGHLVRRQALIRCPCMLRRRARRPGSGAANAPPRTVPARAGWRSPRSGRARSGRR